MNENFDTLIILDACRYDVFEELAADQFDGEFDFRFSTAGTTGGFLNKNFDDQSYSDTVYVTANPWVNIQVPDAFHEIIPVWKTHWDDELQTVPPRKMVEAVLDAHEAYPNKRLIAHFIQPHEPYVGENAIARFGRPYGMERPRKLAEGEYSDLSEIDGDDYPTVMRSFRQGELSRVEAWDAYRENLEVVIPHVQTLVDEVDGKTVLTADHGEMFGEWLWLPYPRQFIGHTNKSPSTELLKVPWFEIDTAERRNVIADQSDPSDINVDREVESKLEALGYR